MGEFIYLVGLNGVGKSTLAKRIAETLNYKYVSSSGLLKELFDVEHSHELEKLDQNLLFDCYTRKFLQLLKEEKKMIILDTHSIIFTADGKERNDQPKQFYRYSKGLINIISEPSNILKRIEMDNFNDSKKRICNSLINETAEKLEKSNNAAKRMALDGNFPYIEFNNPNPLTEITFNSLENIFRKLANNNYVVR